MQMNSGEIDGARALADLVLQLKVVEPARQIQVLLLLERRQLLHDVADGVKYDEVGQREALPDEIRAGFEVSVQLQACSV